MERNRNESSATPEPPQDEARNTATRRRGEVLENAILQAAWDELQEVGYARLSIDAVATRAKTNKNAVYRRWPNKTKLIAAAAVKFVPRPSLEAPDTGELRSDVITLLNGIAAAMRAIGSETIHGMLVDDPDKEIISSLPQTVSRSKENPLTLAMKTIMKNAEARGEVTLQTMKERVISLPFDLIRYEVLIAHEELTEHIITEIVDDIFLPLVLK
ncbi:TetR/AcrR family transcriptional regulator [Paenibacillus medicaginis]|uniref:TetR/AcrR family transcriptional regulator n=1 Tax=Paenibacillus medicaginis TaxID=1470560 RepID=A0ABV5C1E7_9BACL